MRVLAVAPYPATAPSTRFRVGQFLDPLAERGVHVTLHTFLDEAGHRRVRAGSTSPGGLAAVARGVRRLRKVLAAGSRDADVVWIQRGLTSFFDGTFLRRLAAEGPPIVYDFDDAVYLPQEGGRRWLETVRTPEATTRAFCRAAAVVLAGNEHLAAFAREAVAGAGERTVRVLPSVVDTHRFRPGDAHRPGPPTVGWVGSATTLPYLEALRPALEALRDRVDHRLLVVAGAEPPDLGDLPVDFRPWTPETEATVFQELDVGLYPLDATPWSLGKCGFKALQYLACEVPVVASPVGVLRDIVRPGETGVLATGAEAWTGAVAGLLADPARRAALGRRGRALVEARYSVTSALPALETALRDAAAVRVEGA